MEGAANGDFNGRLLTIYKLNACSGVIMHFVDSRKT